MTEQQLARRHPTSARILAFLRGYIGAKGYAPSAREIASAVSLRSTSGVPHHIMRLRNEGFLTYEPNKSRTIVLTKQGEEA